MQMLAIRSKPDRGRLRRPLVGERCRAAEQAGNAGGADSEISDEAASAVLSSIGIGHLPSLGSAPAHAFSSRLSSLRKRQSVPSAMIFLRSST